MIFFDPWDGERIYGEKVVRENGEDLLAKYIMTTPFYFYFYRKHDKHVATYRKATLVWVHGYPKKLKINRSIVENVVKYFEDNQNYDKLAQYGDFYYKLKKLLK